ncbi:MAG: DUF3014 domain-containing protein [Gammaproteobacteria bacterium]
MGRYSLDSKPASKTSFYVWAILLTASVCGGAYYYLGRGPEPATSGSDNAEQGQQVSIALAIPEQHAPTPTESATAAKQALSAENTAGKQENIAALDEKPLNSTADIALPELKKSDAVFKEDIGKLSPALLKWLNADQLITRFLTLVNDLSQGHRIYKHASFLHPDKPFTPKRNAYGFYMDAGNYSRYDAFATAIEALDVQACMAFYKKYRPLMQEVFSTFSYPHNYHIEDILQKAGANIIAAPTIDRPIGLIPHGNRYKFADPQLEGLDPVQKQMLRMGPENTKRIQDKVRQLLQALAA